MREGDCAKITAGNIKKSRQGAILKEIIKKDFVVVKVNESKEIKLKYLSGDLFPEASESRRPMTLMGVLQRVIRKKITFTYGNALQAGCSRQKAHAVQHVATLGASPLERG